MNEVFADTSGWANYFVRTEPFHQNAKELMQQWYKDQTSVITTKFNHETSNFNTWNSSLDSQCFAAIVIGMKFA